MGNTGPRTAQFYKASVTTGSIMQVARLLLPGQMGNSSGHHKGVPPHAPPPPPSRGSYLLDPASTNSRQSTPRDRTSAKLALGSSCLMANASSAKLIWPSLFLQQPQPRPSEVHQRLPCASTTHGHPGMTTAQKFQESAGLDSPHECLEGWCPAPNWPKAGLRAALMALACCQYLRHIFEGGPHETSRPLRATLTPIVGPVEPWSQASARLSAHEQDGSHLSISAFSMPCKAVLESSESFKAIWPRHKQMLPKRPLQASCKHQS